MRDPLKVWLLDSELEDQIVMYFVSIHPPQRSNPRITNLRRALTP